MSLFIKHKYFFIFLTLLQLFAFGYYLTNDSIPISDSTEYLYEAYNIKNNFFIYAADINDKPLRFYYYTLRPPLYPAFIILCTSIYNSIYAIFVFQLLISTFTFYYLIKICELYFENFKSTIFILGILFCPSQIIYTNVVMTEILFQFEIILFLYFILLFFKENKTKWLFISAFLIVCSFMTKPVAILFLIPFTIGLVIYAIRKKNVGWLAIILMPLFMYFSYCKFNEYRTGHYHFTSISNHTLLRYNLNPLLIQKYGTDSAKIIISSIENNKLNYPTFEQQENYVHDACFKFIKKYPIEYGVFQIKGTLNFFIDPGRFDLSTVFSCFDTEAGFLNVYSTGGVKAVVNLLFKQNIIVITTLFILVCWNIFVLANLIFFILSPQHDIKIRLVILILILTICLACGPMGASRFRLPIYPLLLIGLAFSMNYWKLRFKNT